MMMKRKFVGMVFLAAVMGQLSRSEASESALADASASPSASTVLSCELLRAGAEEEFVTLLGLRADLARNYGGAHRRNLEFLRKLKGSPRRKAGDLQMALAKAGAKNGVFRESVCPPVEDERACSPVHTVEVIPAPSGEAITVRACAQDQLCSTLDLKTGRLVSGGSLAGARLAALTKGRDTQYERELADLEWVVSEEGSRDQSGYLRSRLEKLGRPECVPAKAGQKRRVALRASSARFNPAEHKPSPLRNCQDCTSEDPVVIGVSAR